MRALVIFFLLFSLTKAVPVQGPGPLNELDLPSLDPYQPEKAPSIPIQLGSRRKSSQTVRNVNFLSKNSTLISRENCQFFGVKNS